MINTDENLSFVSLLKKVYTTSENCSQKERIKTNRLFSFLSYRPCHLLYVYIKVLKQKCKIILFLKLISVDSRYLEVQRIPWNSSKYSYHEISNFQNWGKHKSNNHILQMNI